MTKAKEFEKFDRTMRKLLNVPKAELTAKLNAERAAKQRKKPRVSGASRVGA